MKSLCRREDLIAPDSVPISTQTLLIHTGYWIIFCIVAVVLRGVRWDENYEFAQNILRWIPYPEGHPLFRYPRGTFSFQTYSTALLLWVTNSPALVCACRNVLFLAATVLPAFLAGAVLSNRLLYGYIAAVFMLAGLHLGMTSSYPQFIWPDMFSNGHIGTGYAIIVVVLILHGSLVPAGFLAGIMPCIHIGQAPPVFLFIAWSGLQIVRKEGIVALRKPAIAFMVGLLFCMCFGLLIMQFSVPEPTSGAYHSDTDPKPIWAGYTFAHDVHRQLPNVNCHIAMVMTLLLVGLVVVSRSMMQDMSRKWGDLWVYVAIVSGIVWFSALIHIFYGAQVPPLVLRWMPYRLPNHINPLLIAACCAVAASGKDRTPAMRIVLVIVLLYLVVLPYIQPLVSETLYARYLRPHVGLLFFLTGAALAQVIRQKYHHVYVPLMCIFIISLGVFHRFGAFCVVIGFCMILVIAKVLEKSTSDGTSLSLRTQIASVLLCAAFLIHTVYVQTLMHSHMPRDSFRVAVSEYLLEKGDGDAMIVGAPFQLLQQAHTGNPVFTDMAVPTWMGYLPSLTQTVGRMYDEVYGIRFAWNLEPERLDEANTWPECWQTRTVEEWKELADAYGFTYVLSPKNTPLLLPRVLEGKNEDLYIVQ